MINKDPKTQKKGSNIKKTIKPKTQTCFKCSKKGPWKKCKYCKEYFCNEHINPYPPSVGLDNPDRHRGDDGHPCAAYVYYKFKEKKRKEEEYSKDLNEFLDSRKKDHWKENSSPEMNYNPVTIRLDDSAFSAKEKVLSKKANKKSTKKFKFWKVIILLILIGFAYIIYSNWSFITSLSIREGDNQSISMLDEETIKLFSYINGYRLEYESPKLTYSEVLYPYLKEVIKSRDLNASSFESSYEFTNYLKESLNLTGLKSSFYKIYFVEGEGGEGFKKKFNKDFSSRRLVRDEKYNYGVVYCSLDNCLLFVFQKEDDIIRFNQTSYEVEEKNHFLGKIGDIITPKEIDYSTSPKTISLNGVGNFIVYGGVNDYLSSLERSISYYTVPPSTKDFILKDLNDPIQKKYLSDLTDRIKDVSSNPEEQARIAIKLVQSIPYDFQAADSGEIESRYPYEVLYDMKGVCMEKSDLLAYLLRDLGYGVAIFEYNSQNHRAVGVKCTNCDYYNSGYCFIESTTQTIPTDSQGDYLGVGKLSYPDETIIISDGISLDLSEECSDAEEWNDLLDEGLYLTPHEYSRWVFLVEKYDIQIDW